MLLSKYAPIINPGFSKSLKSILNKEKLSYQGRSNKEVKQENKKVKLNYIKKVEEKFASGSIKSVWSVVITTVYQGCRIRLTGAPLPTALLSSTLTWLKDLTILI